MCIGLTVAPVPCCCWQIQSGKQSEQKCVMGVLVVCLQTAQFSGKHTC